MKSSIRGVPQIERRGCCCFAVETGSVILGYFGLISSAITMLLVPSLLTKAHFIPIDHSIIDDWYSCIIALWIMSIVSVYFNTLLIKGVLNEQPKLMLPWIYGAYISLIILALVFFGAMAMLLFSTSAQTQEIIYSGIIAVIGAILFFGLSHYFVGVVVTHCQDLIFVQENDLAQYTKPYSLSYDLHNY